MIAKVGTSCVCVMSGLSPGTWEPEAVVCSRKMCNLHGTGKSSSCGFLKQGVSNVDGNAAKHVHAEL